MCDYKQPIRGDGRSNLVHVAVVFERDHSMNIAMFFRVILGVVGLMFCM